ncbi:MAG: hypothetical protein ACK5IQ_10990 [Bacteroidales bacterium]
MTNLILISNAYVAALGISLVFTVLVIVMLVGKLLIRITNKLPHQDKPLINRLKQQTISNNVLAAITATVNILTGGRGVITEIKNK